MIAGRTFSPAEINGGLAGGLGGSNGAKTDGAAAARSPRGDDAVETPFRPHVHPVTPPTPLPPRGSGRSEPPDPPSPAPGGEINARHRLITAAMVELSGLRRLSAAPMAGGVEGGERRCPPTLGDRPPSAPTAPRHRPHPPRAPTPRPGPRSIRSLHQSHASVPPSPLFYWLRLLGPILIR